MIGHSRMPGNLVSASSFRRIPAISASGTGHADVIASRGELAYYLRGSDRQAVEHSTEAMKSSRESW
jgi:metal-dependent amidase/aminoacylase/carboxypeptidase family protein